MSKSNILVSGSGIAGSVFASWLLRAHPDAIITIVERAPALRLTGASVDIRSSAVDIIKWMGAESQIRSCTTKEEGIQFVKASGSPIATLMASGRSEVQSITSEFEIFRGELAKIFLTPVQSQLKIIFDDYVEDLEQFDDRVVVKFAKSKVVKSYDLVVAADGFSSKIRGMMLNTNPQEQIYDEGVHTAYFTAKTDLLKGSRLGKWYNTTGGRVIFLRPDPNPLGRTRVTLMNVTTRGDLEGKERLNNALRGGHESYKKLMDEMFHDAGWLAPEVLKAMRESDDFYCSLFGQIRAPKLQAGRVVLLGDAGYATPGIGTSLAIIGGYVLAGEIMRNPGNFKAALVAYEGVMAPFVKRTQGDNNAMQILNPQTKWGIAIRDTVVGFVTGARLDRLFMILASMFGIKEKMADLPDYKWPADKKH